VPPGLRSDDRSIHALAGEALTATSMADKVRLTAAARAAWRAGDAAVHPDDAVLAPDARGRPPRPVLVDPRQLRQRGLRSPEGRVAAVHAVAHIEANAIDLALDAAHRFRGLPDAYYDDWLRVAEEEARHFGLLSTRLVELGAAYGDLPAHGGLWTACARSADDVLRRMALVPRVLEARGLDVNPPMIARFRAAGDGATAAVLEVVLADEIGHVAVGDRWFRWCCASRGLDPVPTFAGLLTEAGVRVRPPLNVEARLAAGFDAAELTALTATDRA
jgi:uncharacterized ferritin-like protein (DUF455 family)